VYVSRVSFSPVGRRGEGSMEGEDEEEFRFGVGGEEDVWNAGEVQELRSWRGDYEEGC
jgi:hypothetical protein